MDIICAICLDPFTSDNLAVCGSNCGHVFHYGCIFSWMTNQPNCPICKVQPLHLHKVFFNFHDKMDCRNCPELEAKIELLEQTVASFEHNTATMKTHIGQLLEEGEASKKELKDIKKKMTTREKKHLTELGERDDELIEKDAQLKKRDDEIRKLREQLTQTKAGVPVTKRKKSDVKVETTPKDAKQKTKTGMNLRSKNAADSNFGVKTRSMTKKMTDA